jgi:hypothetical protein
MAAASILLLMDFDDNMMLHRLSRLAEVHNIAVVITNQVQSQPDDFSA